MSLSTISLLYYFLLKSLVPTPEFPSFPPAANPDNPEECLTDQLLKQQLEASPNLREIHDKMEENAAHYLAKRQSGGVQGQEKMDFVLPVVVHIIHQNGPENVSDAEVLQAIDWLNDGFANTNYYDQGVGVDTRIQFCLAKRDPGGNATSGINRVVSPLTDVTNDLAMKDLSRWDPNRYINIWLVKVAGGAGGYATLPSSHGSPSDGIVMLAEKIKEVGSGHSTMIHELGHYLGLYHTFQGGCTNNDCLLDGDRVCDTPPDGTTAPPPTCFIAVNSCSSDTNSGWSADQDDIIWNYVDYGNYACRAGYTQGQADRMAYFVENVRFSLLNTEACIDPCPNPYVASFTADQTNILMGETVNFTNTSTGGDNYTWQVNGVTFSTNPNNAAYTFSDGAGDYIVSLICTTADPNCTEVFEQTITVRCPAEASFIPTFFETIPGGTIDFANTSTNSNDFQWFVDGVQYANTPDFTFTFPAAGNYQVVLRAADSTGFCTDEYALIVQVVCVSASFSTDNFYPVPGSDVALVNTSQGANSVSWSVNGTAAGNADTLFYQFIDPGIYTVCIAAENNNCDDVNCQEMYVFENISLNCTSTFIKKMGSVDIDEQAFDLVPDGNGNFYLLGRKDSRSIILLIDPSGNIIDQRSFDFTSGNDFIVKILIDNNGFIIGSSRDQINASTVNLAFKYDWQNDIIIWAKSFSDPAYTRIEGIYQNPSNGNYVFYGMVTPGPLDKYLVELDEDNGSVIWQRQIDYGGNTDIALNHVVYGGSVYLAGPLRVGFSLSDIRGYISNFDFNGNLNWTKTYLRSPSQPSRLYNMQMVIENDKIYNIGHGTLSGDVWDESELLFFNTEINGDLNWAKKYSINNGTALVSPQIATITDGFIISGRYLENSGINSLFFTKVDKNGQVIWAKKVGTNGNDGRCRFTIANGFIVFATHTDAYDNGNNNDILFGRISLDGQVLSAGCDLVESLELLASDIANPYEGPEQPVVFEPTYQWETETFANQSIAMNNEDVPGCECQEFSVPCEATFITTYGTSESETAQAAVAVADGIIVGGNSASGGVHLRMLSKEGATLWERSFDPTNQQEELASLSVDSDGRLLGAGSTNTNNVGERRPFAFKYDYQNNNLIWIKTLDYFGLQQAGFYEVLENPVSGNYFITGRLQNAPGGLGCDGLLLEVDRNTGDLINANGFNLGSCEDFIRTIIVNGKLYTTGRYNFAGGGTNRMRSAISEIDFSGNELWSRLYLVDVNTSARLYSNDIISENNALFVIGNGDTDNTSATDISFQFFKTNIDGSIIWAKDFNIIGANTEHGRRVLAVPDGFILAGNFIASNNNSNIFLLKTDKNGNMLWGKAFGGPANDGLRDMIYQDGQIYLIGYTENFGAGNEDFLLMKLDLNGNILDENCDIEIPVTITENNFNNPYDGIHSLTKFNFNGSLNNASENIINQIFTETQLCYASCLDTCANGALRDSVPDAVLQVIDGQCRDGAIHCRVQICNNGEVVLPASTPLSFYAENPTQTNTTLLANASTNAVLQVGECQVFGFDLGLPYNQKIFVVVNDNGTTPTPFDLFADFPNTNVAECDFTNNLGSFTVDYIPPVLDLGPDISECHFGVTDLDAGAGFLSYAWSDNTGEQVTTVYEPGTYWVTVRDSCGGVQTDTIVIELDPATVIDIGMDTAFICEGEDVTFSVTGFSTYQWVPADHLNCDTCAEVTAAPDTLITYRVVAGNGDGCVSEDSVTVVVLPVVHTYDTLQFCLGDTVVVFGEEVTQEGNYTATFSGQTGCDSIHQITLVAQTDTILLMENAAICEGDSLLFFGEWLTQPGVYEHTDSSGGCIRQTVLTLSFTQSFSLSVDPVAVQCFGDTDGQMTATTDLQNALFSLDGTNFQPENVFTGLGGGEYVLTVLDTLFGCTYEEYFTIEEPVAVAVSLPADVTIELGDTYFIVPTFSASLLSYQWSPDR